MSANSHQPRSTWTHELGPFRDASRHYDISLKPQQQIPQQIPQQTQKQQPSQQLKARPANKQSSSSSSSSSSSTHARQQSSSAIPSSPASTNQQRFSPIMNRQYRSATVGSDEPQAREIPDCVYGPGSPLARGRINRRRRSTLHDILERARKRQEQKEQDAALNQTPKNMTGATEAADAKPRASRQHPLSIPQPLSPAADQAHSMPQESSVAFARAVHKAELQHRRPSQDEERPGAGSLGMGKKSSRSSLMQRRAEHQGLKLLSASKASRESMERGSASRSESLERLTGLSPLALSKKTSGQFPYRIERTYRVVDHSKNSDDEGSGKASDKDAETSPSSSPMSAVFQLPPVQPPPQPRDLPPLPEPLQKQLQQLPRLSPPRKLPMSNKPTLQLGLPEPGLPITPTGLSQSSNRRVVSGSSLLRSPSNTSFTDIQSTQNMHIVSIYEQLYAISIYFLADRKHARPPPPICNCHIGYVQLSLLFLVSSLKTTSGIPLSETTTALGTAMPISSLSAISISSAPQLFASTYPANPLSA
ncbi:hypothetical protein BX070DRAFT_235542 [Coemansia spiralis]|nr:hypothetical protein BX070DRAFT_235542 [Coemansia spiralis]